jgi:hypothetical protein
MELLRLLCATTTEKSRGIEGAYRVSQGIQALLNSVREQIREEYAAALKREETRYRHTTDGGWLSGREDYYKALTESLYLQRRAGLIETLLVWWSDVLRAANGVERRELSAAAKETGALSKRFTIPDILRRIRRLEELRDHLGRNIQETLAIEVAFLKVFSD